MKKHFSIQTNSRLFANLAGWDCGVAWCGVQGARTSRVRNSFYQAVLRR
jgi:hypothetical protein